MNALSQSQKIQTSLTPHLTPNHPILTQLATLTTHLQSLDKAIQTTAEVHSALTLVTQMMDAAYDRHLDADSLRCLLAPLKDKLGKSLEEMRWLM